MGVTSHSGVSSDNDCTFGNELSRRSKPSRNTFSCEMWGDRNPPEAASAIPFYRASWSLRRFWINQLILLLFLECRSQPSLENIILNTWFLFEGDCLEQINKYQFRFGCELNSTVVFLPHQNKHRLDTSQMTWFKSWRFEWSVNSPGFWQRKWFWRTPLVLWIPVAPC